MTRNRAFVTAAIAAAVVAALTGCGVAGTDFRPGLAAEVGDTQIRKDVVEETTTNACAHFSDVNEGQNPVPRGSLSAELVGILVQQAAFEQILPELGVEVGPDYQAAIAQIETDTADLDEDRAEALRLANGAVAYNQLAAIAVGIERLSPQEAATAGQEGLVAAGNEALSEWLLERDAEGELEFNPVYGLSLDEQGRLVGEGDDTSVVVSDQAESGVMPDTGPDPEYVESLPETLTCG